MKQRSLTSGFSLVQLSVLLAVSGLVIAAMLPGSSASGDAQKAKVTLERMQRIEQATQVFMAKNLRRPRPADLTLAVSAANFGKELTTTDIPDEYAGVAPTNYFTQVVSTNTTKTTRSISTTVASNTSLRIGWLVSGTGISNAQIIRIAATTVVLNAAATTTSTDTGYFRNPLIVGGVPTRALGLPDEFAVDGYGRRLMYMVDMRATNTLRCDALQSASSPGFLMISDSTTFDTDAKDRTMWALMSYGKDGQGAVPAQGSSLSSRRKTGNTDTSSIYNAFYDATEANSYVNVGLVKKSPTSTFDDIVWYQESTKNTCRLGQKNGFFIGGTGSSIDSATFVDMNGDGIKDIALGSATDQRVYVIFGKKGGWPQPGTTFDIGALGANLNGTNGFTVIKGTLAVTLFGTHLTAGDINNDGYEDLAIAAKSNAKSNTGPGYIVLFGQRDWSSNYSYTINTGTMNGSTGIDISNQDTNFIPYAEFADVNNDGIRDLLIETVDSAEDRIAVILGRSSAWTSQTGITTTDPSHDYLDGTKGYAIRDAGNATFLTYPGSGVTRHFTACDVDGDGDTDIVLSRDKDGVAHKTVILLNPWTVASKLVDINNVANTKKVLSYASTTGDPAARSVYCGYVLNSDKRADILIHHYDTNAASPDSYLGWQGIASPADVADMTVSTGYNYKVTLDTGTVPTWKSAGTSADSQMLISDWNNSSTNDLIVSRFSDSPQILTTSTSIGIVPDTLTGSTRSNAGIAYFMLNGATAMYSNTSFAMVGKAGDKINVMASTDLDGDGKNDYLIRSNDATAGGAYLVFGRSRWSSVYDLNCLRDTSTGYCFKQLNTAY